MRNIAAKIIVFTGFCVLGLLCQVVSAQTVADQIRMEADYILACQDTDKASSFYGAINNVTGEPTWVMPGENAVAIMGLLRASEYLGDSLYRDRGELAMDYLLRVQADDGAWYTQYDYSKPDGISERSKHLRHTVEVMMAMDKLGYRHQRYSAMEKAADFVLSCQDPLNKKGRDDGLVGGGKEVNGDFSELRWTSDNSFAYHALQGAANWAEREGKPGRAHQYRQAAARILDGLKNFLLAPDGVHWLRVIDGSGQIYDEVSKQFFSDPSQERHDWISYAPVMLDVPVEGVDPSGVGEWIHTTLQDTNNALVWDDTLYPQRESPGYSFQAMLVWLDTGQSDYAQWALEWAVNSGLWQTSPDYNGITGGWIDWIENSNTPEWWLRFIDTSAYFIMARTDGYDFSAIVIPEPTTLLLFGSALLGFLFLPLKRKN